MFNRVRGVVYGTVISMFLTLALLHPVHSLAADQNKLNVPFVVTPLLPENQRAGVLGYFDLIEQPGAHQTIYVKVRNDSDQPLTLNVTAANALTAVNGGIQYVENDGTDNTRFLDKKHAFRNAISVAPKVAIAAKSMVDVPVEINVPNEDTGTFLGGVLFAAEDSSQQSQATPGNNNVNFTLNNRLVVATAIQVDLPKSAEPAFSFGETGIQTVASGSQFYIQMRNQSPTILKEVSGDFEVVSETGSTVLKGPFGPFNMAPQTEIHYPVLWNNTLSPGKYTVKLQANFNGKNVSEQRNFSIGVKDLKEYHDTTGRNPIAFSIPVWWWWVGGGFLLVLISVSFWLGKRQKPRVRHRNQRSFDEISAAVDNQSEQPLSRVESRRRKKR